MRARTALIVVNSTGSAAVFRKPLIGALKSHGFSVIVATPDGREIDQIREMNVEVVVCGVSRSGLGLLENVRYFVRLFKLIRSKRPDVVHTFTHKCNIAGGTGAALLKVPGVYLNVTGMGTMYMRNGATYRLARLGTKVFYRLLARRVSAVLVQNQRDTELMRRMTGLSEKKVVHVPGSGVDTDFYKPLMPEERLHLRSAVYGETSSSRRIFLLCARAVKEKGVGEFYIAAKRFTATHPGQARFVHIGDSEQFDSLGFDATSLASAAEEHSVEYLGHKTDVRPYLQGADVGCLPSHREGLSRFLTECLSTGLPVITTDAPGCSDVVMNNRNGFVVPAGDADELCRAFETACSSDLACLGRESRDIALQFFSAQNVTDQVLSLMESKAE